MKKLIITFSIFAFFASSCVQLLYAQLQIPAGFSELKYSPVNGLPMERMYIDFDGDGKKDTATVIGKDNYGNVWEHFFLIHLTSSNKTHKVQMFGYDRRVNPVQLNRRNNVIHFSYFLAGTSTFFRTLKLRYNPTNQRIQLIGYDSSYRITSIGTGGRTEKSFNLLTGDFVVTNRFRYLSDDVFQYQEHRGNHRIRPIFIEDINDELLGELDLVGREFELDFKNDD